MEINPLDRKADIRSIRSLYRDGLLTRQAFENAARILRPASIWLKWARRMLLFFGCALVLAGIIFFFAYNWYALGRFLKLGLVETAIIGCILALYFLSFEKLTGKVLLLSASVLVGVLLAVYGQTYQTGADAYELFIGWAALIFGWVLISEFAGLWLVWLVILNTGAILYWHQVAGPTGSVRYELFCFALAMLNALALVLRESGLRKGLKWLSGSWLRGILLAGSLIVLTVPAIYMIVDFSDNEAVSAFSIFAWILAAAGGYIYYRYKIRDMLPVALVTINACIILLTLIGKALFHDMNYYNAAPFLVFSLVIVGVVTGAAFLLKAIAAKMSLETGETAE